MGSHKKHKKEKKAKKHKKEKKSKKKRRRHSSSSDSSDAPIRDAKRTKTEQPQKPTSVVEPSVSTEPDYDVPLPPGFSVPAESTAPTRLPMTKEQYEARAKQIRRVLDPHTGRHRLIRGEGEVIEEAVSRDRHRQINQQATRGDGEAFQRTLQASLR